MIDETDREAHRLANAADRELISRVAHDYGNVLTVISGSIELALRRLAHCDPEDAERQLHRAQEAIKRGTALSSRLAAFSRGDEIIEGARA